MSTTNEQLNDWIQGLEFQRAELHEKLELLESELIANQIELEGMPTGSKEACRNRYHQNRLLNSLEAIARSLTGDLYLLDIELASKQKLLEGNGLADCLPQ